MKNLVKQILRFGLVGGLAFVIDYGLMIFLTEQLQVHYLISSCVSFCVSVIFNYWLSIHWVFSCKQPVRDLKQLFMFTILSIVGLGINQLCMWVLVDKMYIHYMLSKIFATGIVMVYNFISRKLTLE